MAVVPFSVAFLLPAFPDAALPVQTAEAGSSDN
jgi:hypothetical protein